VLDVSEFCLDLIRVDDSSKICNCHNWSIESISFFFEGFSFVCSKYLIESFECIFCEDNESSKMSTWSELENIQSVYIAYINSWKVSCCLFDVFCFVTINNEWSFSQNIS
jgi:hypothetical protein